MSAKESVSHWIAALKTGDFQAAQQLWDRYKSRLLELARIKLAGKPKRVADEEDVAQCVFICLCRGAAAGRFDDIRNRDDLWWLLLAMTRDNAVDLIRREAAARRGGGHVQSECDLAIADDTTNRPVLDQIIGYEPTPELIVMLDEQHRYLLKTLANGQLRRIAVSRIEGFTVEEIAAELALSTRSIERKLQMIRVQWTKELLRAEGNADAGT